MAGQGDIELEGTGVREMIRKSAAENGRPPRICTIGENNSIFDALKNLKGEGVAVEEVKNYPNEQAAIEELIDGGQMSRYDIFLADDKVSNSGYEKLERAYAATRAIAL